MSVLMGGVRPESKSWPKPAWLLGSRCGLVCGMDAPMDAQLFKVWVQISIVDARTIGVWTHAADRGSLVVRSDPVADITTAQTTSS